jgi:hypothetical protein
LWVYAWTTVSPGPDYYTRKIRFMFSIPDPGYATWLGIFGLILGFILICMGLSAAPDDPGSPALPRERHPVQGSRPPFQ